MVLSSKPDVHFEEKWCSRKCETLDFILWGALGFKSGALVEAKRSFSLSGLLLSSVGAQDAPKWPTMAQDSPKMAPSWPQMVPGWPQAGPRSPQAGGGSGPKWCPRRGQTLTLRKSGALVEVKRSISHFWELWVSKVVLSSRRNARFHFPGFS